MLADIARFRAQSAWFNDGVERRALRVQKLSSVPEQSKLSFYAPDFARTFPEPWLVGDELEWPALEPQPLPQVILRQTPERVEFEKLCHTILTRIRNGDFQKVVPMISEVWEFSTELSPPMFAMAFTPSKNEFSYGFHFRGEGMVGVTPEILFSVKEGRLETMALAGTGAAEGPSLLEIPKERDEHLLVIENLHSHLRAFGKVDVGETQERAFRRIKHLFTPIRVALDRKVQFAELVATLHPTAALGGWPREAAWSWLAQQDFHTRRLRFGAPFGYQRNGEMVCAVAIRGLQWSGRKALLSAGCGVVAQSEPRKEWDELLLKLSALKTNLGLPV